jgi:predicted transcriptional regulator
MSAKKIAGATKNVTPDSLSRREREILNILYRRGRATAVEVQESLSDPPSYSAVRAMLRILEDKGHATHEQDGQRYVYLPSVSRDRAKRSALKNLLSTFFENSAEQAISALLDDSGSKLSGEDLDRISEMVERARKEGR